jgi:hypothetical protein
VKQAPAVTTILRRVRSEGTLMLKAAVLCCVAALAYPSVMSGAGGGYVIDGGTKVERQTVAEALAASTFDWSVVPGPIQIHIVRGAVSRSVPHQIWLDADLLDSGTFSWGVVQHEYAHQVDYLLFDDATRAELLKRLGGQDWCYAVAGLAHDEYGCERFASTLAWAFWPSRENCMRPSSRNDESAAMEPKKFRALVDGLVHATLARRGH